MITSAMIFHIVAVVFILGLVFYCAYLLSNFHFLRRCINTETIVDSPERFLKKICSILEISLDVDTKTPEKLAKINARAFLHALLTGAAIRIEVKSSPEKTMASVFVRDSKKIAQTDIAHLLGDSIVVRWIEASK